MFLASAATLLLSCQRSPQPEDGRRAQGTATERKGSVGIGNEQRAPDAPRAGETTRWTGASKLGIIGISCANEGSGLALCGARVGGRWVVDPEWIAIDIVKSRAGANGVELALLRFDSAGSACAYHFRILDVSGAEPAITEAFGNCGGDSAVEDRDGGWTVRIAAFGRLPAEEIRYSDGKLVVVRR